MITSCVDWTTSMCRRGIPGYSAPDGNRIPREVLVTTIEKSVGVRGSGSTSGPIAEDTPHDGVVTSNRPAERTAEVSPTAVVGTEPNAVTHNDAGSGGRRGPGSPRAGDHREHRVDDNGQHMA
jgi:hypothetical protein